MGAWLLLFPLSLLLVTGCRMNEPLPDERAGGAKSVTRHPDVRVEHPGPEDLVSSPLRVTGQARGRWFFEASFPITLLDGQGNAIAESYVTAQGEWMTPEFVPFSGEIRFNSPATPNGTLVLRRANASGLPEHDAHVQLPVRFRAE